MLGIQPITCVNCGAQTSVPKVLSVRAIQALADKPQQFTCPKCQSILECAAGSNEWILKQPQIPPVALPPPRGIENQRCDRQAPKLELAPGSMPRNV
jgi:hypothetical protein